MAATMLIREKKMARVRPPQIRRVEPFGSATRTRPPSTTTIRSSCRPRTRNTAFEKVLRMHISAGTFTEVSNPNFYLDGANSFGTGRKLWMNNTAQGTYTQGTVPTETNDPPQFPGSTPMIDAFGPPAVRQRTWMRQTPGRSTARACRRISAIT